jgi:3-oxoacyl-[acyl-carrier protein] reductase/meso-butanediol dehydrogenase/(S,S)-butanediol dehydrogenase/diacetyl reductase
LAKELGKKNIRVNAICPVLVRTEGLIEALGKDSSPANAGIDNFMNSFIKEQVALSSLPNSRDVGKLCLFLASSDASSITGQCINLDSGVIPS